MTIFIHNDKIYHSHPLRASPEGHQMFIFDCHVHLPSPGLHYTWEWQPNTPDIPSAIRYLKRCGVGRILANSVRGEIAQTIEEMVAGNDEIAQAAKCYPDYITPACLVNANYPDAAQKELERCHQIYKMIRIGELCGYAGGYTYATPAFSDLVRLAIRLNMILHIHNDNIDDMERLGNEFPEATFVLAHLGDDPDQITRRVGLAASHPNLYLDICGNGFERMGVLEYAVRNVGPDRILFGSDFTINDPAGVIARIKHTNLDAPTRQKILCGNLLHLLVKHNVILAENT